MTFEEFEQLSKSFNVIPLTRRTIADTLTPVSAYLRLREGARSSFLLESVEGGERFARYSFIGRDPAVLLSCRDRETTIERFQPAAGEAASTTTTSGNFLDTVDALAGGYRQAPAPDLPRFRGGLVGFIGYDAVRFIEEIPRPATPADSFYDSIVGIFPSVLAFDHFKHQIAIIVNVVVDPSKDLRAQYNDGRREIERLEALLLKPPAGSERFRVHPAPAVEGTERDEFASIVRKAKQYITDGDIFQVVLSRRTSTRFEGDPFNAYRALRIINPSPYLYYLDFNQFSVIGSSPEILVRVEGGLAEVYPIAGTRPRGRTEAEDKALEAELLADEKERAEHVMLVDLGRNDLGRVCETGSISVEQLMTTVRYSHVMHLASRITGRIRSGQTCIDVFKAAFPAGTVSGAPKIRAMQIIDELEKTRRGLYAGGVGYIDFSGNMDMCIAIRTMFACGGRIYIQSGAGIVADSDPGREYEETANKARAMVEALRMAEGIVH